MVSGQDSRNHSQRDLGRGDGLHASIVSGQKDRNKYKDAELVILISSLASMVSGQEGRKQVDHLGIIRSDMHAVVVQIPAMVSGHEGRNQLLHAARPTGALLIASMVSGQAGRNRIR
jgi:hypothetical protein